MINVNLNFNDMATLLFGAEEAEKMKERSARRQEADKKAWKAEMDKIFNMFNEVENDDIIKEVVGKEELMPLKVKTMVNRFRAKNKDMATKWIGAVKNNKAEGFKSDVVEVTMQELASEILAGKAIIPAVIDGRIEDINFREQQLFALDIDYIGTSLRDLKAKLADYPYAIIYTSFSHTEAVPKYRVLFVADRVITDAQEARQITAALMEVAGCADDKCVDVSRVFYAGRSIVEVQDKMFSVDKLLANTSIVYEEVLPAENKEKVEVLGTEEAGEDNIVITADEIIKNLSSITEYEGMELDYDGSFNWINNNIDLSVLLGKKVNTLFRCMNPEHLDRKPSALVYKYGNKSYYRCNCGHFHKPKSVIDTVSLLLDMDKVEAQYLITDALGIIMGSAYQRNSRLLIADTKANLTKMIKPGTVLYKEMRYLWGTLNVIQDFASSKITISPLSINSTRPTFFMSRSQLQAEMIRLGVKGSSNVKAKLDQLKDLGFIRPLLDEEIVEARLKEAKEVKKKQLMATQKKYINRVEYYELCSIAPSMIRKAEELIALRKKSGAKKKNMNVTRRLAVYGEEHTQKVNPQGQVINKICFNKNQKEMDKLVEAATTLIEKQGYFTEEQLRKAFDPKRKKRKDVVEKLIDDAIPVIIKALGIEKNRVKNSTRTLHSIPSKIKSNTTIYC